MVKIKEFKGNKVIMLMRDDKDKYPISFGVVKAKLILENIKEIEKFVADNQK